MKVSMKAMNFLTFMLATFVLLSCNKEDTEISGDNTAAKRVIVKIATLQSKAQEDQIPTGTYTAIEDAVILFYNNADAQVFSHELSGAEIATLTAAATAGTVTINGIPASAEKVAIIANYKASGQGSTYSGINKSATIDVAKLHPATGVAKVIMYGTGTISPTDSGGNTFPASVTISPAASRLEVSGISTKRAGADAVKGEIKSYKLKGVFVPNHYPTGTIEGVTGSPATGNGILVKPVDATNYTASFPLTTGTGLLNDYNPSELTVTGAVFGYNVFPASEVANLPNVVIAVSDVVYISDDAGSEATLDNGNVKYITITEFYTDAAKQTPLTLFKNANVYGIEALLFGLEDLGDTPYTKAKNVAVTIKITPWTYQQIYPGI